MFTLLLFACTSELDNKTAATINNTPKERVEQRQQAQSPNARELKIDPSSKIEWVGSKVSGDHRGGFQKISGNVMISGSEKMKIEELQAEFDMNSLFSDSKKLTQHLLSPDFFDAESFPKSSFRMTNYENSNMTGVLTLPFCKSFFLTGILGIKVNFISGLKLSLPSSGIKQPLDVMEL